MAETKTPPEPEAWLVQWNDDGEIWVDAHADEPRARDQARSRGGECIPMIRQDSSQASRIEELVGLLAEIRKWMDTDVCGPWDAKFIAAIDATLSGGQANG